MTFTQFAAMRINPVTLVKELAAQSSGATANTAFEFWAEKSCRIVTEADFYPPRALANGESDKWRYAAARASTAWERCKPSVGKLFLAEISRGLA